MSKEKNTTKTLTVQKMYQIALPRAKALKKKAIEGTITDTERMQLDTMLTKLWDNIKRYAYKEANAMSEGFAKDSEFTNDLKQNLHLKWLEKLWNYDPTQTAPTTYFKFYFKEVVRGDCVSESQKMPQSVATNVRKVRMARAYLEQKGMRNPDVTVLAEKAGLSIKVTKETLMYEANSKQADIDDVVNDIAFNYTPEKAVLKSDESKALFDICNESLEQEELNLLMAYIDSDDSYYNIKDIYDDPAAIKAHNSKYKQHYMTQTALAAKFNLDPTEVTSMLNIARSKIASNTKFKQTYGTKTRRDNASINLSAKDDAALLDIRNALFGINLNENMGA